MTSVPHDRICTARVCTFAASWRCLAQATSELGGTSPLLTWAHIGADMTLHPSARGSDLQLFAQVSTHRGGSGLNFKCFGLELSR